MVAREERLKVYYDPPPPQLFPSSLAIKSVPQLPDQCCSLTHITFAPALYCFLLQTAWPLVLPRVLGSLSSSLCLDHRVATAGSFPSFQEGYFRERERGGCKNRKAFHFLHRMQLGNSYPEMGSRSVPIPHSSNENSAACQRVRWQSCLPPAAILIGCCFPDSRLAGIAANQAGFHQAVGNMTLSMTHCSPAYLKHCYASSFWSCTFLGVQ